MSIRFLAALLLATVAGSALAEPPKPLLWKVSDADNAIYLLGSFHLLKAGDYPLSPDAYAALDDAEKVVFELSPAEMNDPALGQKMAMVARRSDGKTLQAALPGETWAQLVEYAAKRQIALQNFQGFDTWFMGLVIGITEMQIAGLDSSLGLDKHFAERAQDAGKQVGALETADQQFAMFDGMSPAEQLQQLQDALGDVAAMEQEINRMHALWRAGDAEALFAMSGAEKKVASAVPREAIPNLSEHVVALRAGEVVLALEERRNALPLNDLLRVKTTGVHVNDIASFSERETGRVDLATTNPSGLIFSDGFSAGQRISKVGKRLFDIVASLIVLIVGLPLILVAGIAVVLDSRGPVFHRQPRVGLFGEPYDIYKIRSMRTDAEAEGKAVWASENDSRITRVGRIIRKLRIDELPQLWCVLKGEMSFVGPRPERPSFVEELEQKMPFYAERHMVKPGLTGWAQINYPYGASVEDARVKLEYDLYYAKNYSPFLDLLILLQTVRVVLWPDGAR